MGLFSSKKKTYVGTSVVRVVDDLNIPNSPKTGLLRAILQDQDIAPHILEEFSGSIGMRVNRMYDYAAKNSPLGLPTKQFSNRGLGRDLVQQILEGIEGQPIELEYSILGAPNIMHFARMKVISQFGYEPTTNILRGLSTPTVTEYLDSIDIVLPKETEHLFDDAALEQWGMPSTGGFKPWERLNASLGGENAVKPIKSSGNTTTDFVQMTYGHMNPVRYMGSLPVIKTTVNLSLPEVDDEADYFHAYYDVGGVKKFWAYQKGLGTYPQLDSLVGEGSPLGSFYPFLYFRYNKKPVDANLNADVYRENKKIAKMIGINFDDLRESIHENPDIADVEQAMLTFSVPANTTDPSERRYLYSFFDEMYFAVGTGDARPVSSVNNFLTRHNTAAKNMVSIQDAWFTTTLSNAGMIKNRKVGVLGPVGTHDSGFVKSTFDQERIDAESGGKYIEKVPYDYHYYRRQISDVLYDEIQVLNLKMTYNVYGSHTTTGDDLGDILLVPLDRKIIDDWSIPEREVLVSRAMHMVFNSRVDVKVKWYQTGLFKAIMIIVMVVITFWTGGASAAGLGAALAAGGSVALSAIWTMIIIPILDTLLLSMVLKFFVQQLGGEFAMLVAVVAMAYGAYNYFGDMASTWGEILLSVGNGLFKAIGDNYTDLLGDVYAELEAFSEYSSDMWDQLEETSKQLLGEQNNYMSPFILFGEAPSDYYARTVHSGNIGTNSFAAVSNYADVALKLPTIEDTLNFSNEGNENV